MVAFNTPWVAKETPNLIGVTCFHRELCQRFSNLLRRLFAGMAVADQLVVMPDQGTQQPEKSRDSQRNTSNVPAFLDQLGISLIVSTYQAGKAIVVRSDNGTLNTHFRTFAKPMGIVADTARLTIGGANTVWEYRNMPAVAQKLEPAGKHDACYLPRRIHVTGDIDIHELAWAGDGELWVVNTRFCCLCTLDDDRVLAALATAVRQRLGARRSLPPQRPSHGRRPPEVRHRVGRNRSRWRLARKQGQRRRAYRRGDERNPAARIVHAALAALAPGKLWLLESGEGSLAQADLGPRTWRTVAQVPGFTRGIDLSARWLSSACRRYARRYLQRHSIGGARKRAHLRRLGGQH